MPKEDSRLGWLHKVAAAVTDPMCKGLPEGCTVQYLIKAKRAKTLKCELSQKSEHLV